MGYLYWQGEGDSAEQYWGFSFLVPDAALFWQTYTDGNYYCYGSIYKY